MEGKIKSWDQRCAEAIQRERLEVERKYNIRIGQTDIHCARCGRPWGSGRHECRVVIFPKQSMKSSPRASCEATGG